MQKLEFMTFDEFLECRNEEYYIAQNKHEVYNRWVPETIKNEIIILIEKEAERIVLKNLAAAEKGFKLSEKQIGSLKKAAEGFEASITRTKTRMVSFAEALENDNKTLKSHIQNTKALNKSLEEEIKSLKKEVKDLSNTMNMLYTIDIDNAEKKRDYWNVDNHRNR